MKKVAGIQIQIKDKISKKSKAFTVHGMSTDKLFYKILFFVKRLQESENISVVCYKGGDKDEKEIGRPGDSNIQQADTQAAIRP